MPSSRRQKSKPKTAARPARPPAKKAAPKPKAPPKSSARSAKPAGTGSKSAPRAKPEPEVVVAPRPTGRIHVLSLSFVRDGDEFLARMETDSGQITELKNRSLDQLLTLVASELEDLLE
jgi:hypothetical protein